MSQLKLAIWHCEEEKGKTWSASACFSCTLKESSCSPSYNLASPRIWIHYLSTLRSLPISTLFPSFTHLLMHLILRTKNPAVIHDHWTMNAISEMSVKISIQSLKQLQVAALLSGNCHCQPPLCPTCHIKLTLGVNKRHICLPQKQNICLRMTAAIQSFWGCCSKP